MKIAKSRWPYNEILNSQNISPTSNQKYTRKEENSKILMINIPKYRIPNFELFWGQLQIFIFERVFSVHVSRFSVTTRVGTNLNC